jgi:hypothetical protein
VTIVVTLDGDDALDGRLVSEGWVEIHRDDDGAVFVRAERETGTTPTSWESLLASAP